MARKSRKIDFVNVGNEVLAEQAKQDSEKKVSHAALYARLSFESELNRERNTIETQMALLHSYADTKEDIVVEKEYFDISKTGTNFDREGFEEMMKDISAGIIDCVIVKDLSRLGRNYVEAGSYIEQVFPFFGVRFISVNEQYDSEWDDVSLLIRMSNVYNEYYSKDLAKKVRSAHRAYWEKGEYAAGCVAYGYEKDKENSHLLIPDTIAAPVVQKIFRMFLEGTNYSRIANALNNEGYLCPKAYKRQKAGRELGEYSQLKWTGSTVNQLLQNQYYVGDSVHNRFVGNTWAEKKKIETSKEEWIIIENTHEPLVSREDFKKTQDKMEKILIKHRNPKDKGASSVKEFNYFKSKIVCADCGKTMYLSGKRNINKWFTCGSHVLYKRCFKHTILDTDVNDYVLRIIRTHINVYLENVDMIRKMNQRQESVRKYDVFDREIKKCLKEQEKLAKHREQLFEDYANRLIDGEQYETFAQQDADREKEIQKNMDILLKYKMGYEQDFHTDEEWEKIINKFRNTRTLTKDMVDAFVSKVEIHADRTITVHLVYDDMMKELTDFVKERESELCR